MLNNLFVLSDAREECRPVVNNGSCNTAVVDKRINEANRRLIVKADWPFTTQTVRVRVDNMQFPLPRECEKVIWANICGNSAYVRNSDFEFLASGPGEVMHRAAMSGLKDLIDAGIFPTMYDIPPIESFEDDATSCTDRTLADAGWYLVAFSTDVADLGESLTVYGSDRLLNDVDSTPGVSTFSPGEALPLNVWGAGGEGTIDGNWADLQLTSKTYRHIKQWVKPVTKGYVTLYAVNPDNNYMYLLAKAHPDDTIPFWRRYKISGQCCVNDCANILMLCKMKAIPLTRDNDILPIQNLDAIKNMVMAIEFENKQALDNALKYEANAVRLLKEQKDGHELAGGAPAVIDFETELMAAPMNRRII